jgi:hypothetical protein
MRALFLAALIATAALVGCARSPSIAENNITPAVSRSSL